jgi:uncharacterized membrane protein SpoIIM required for sporulation
MRQTQDEFVAARRADWEELGRILFRSPSLGRLQPAQISRAAALYRAVCNDVMRARAGGYSADLTAHLDDLAGRAHNALYAAPPHRWSAVGALYMRDFPRAVRKQVRFVVLSALLFFVPGAVGFLGAYGSRGFAAEILDEQTITSMDEAYSKGFEKGRDPGVNSLMAGFYVFNNVGIAFRCFATGILFGLGSVFFLIYNGLFTGTVIGLVARAGHAHNIFTFMCGHSTFELTAIVFAGAAGMQMGYALVATGGLTRWGSLRSQARQIASLVLGTASMLLIAAGIEGFWSPSSLPAPVKWTAAVGLALLLVTYFIVVGRRREAAA